MNSLVTIKVFISKFQNKSSRSLRSTLFLYLNSQLNNNINIYYNIRNNVSDNISTIAILQESINMIKTEY